MSVSDGTVLVYVFSALEPADHLDHLVPQLLHDILLIDVLKVGHRDHAGREILGCMLADCDLHRSRAVLSLDRQAIRVQ